MRLIIFAFNPHYIDGNAIVNLQKWLEDTFNCNSYAITHYDREADPLYIVYNYDTIIPVIDFGSKDK